MASKISINLDTSKENYLVSKCKQNDDLTLEGFIFENGEALDLSNKEITIQALKADNTYIIQNTDITKSNNNFTANLVKDFSRVTGTTKIEIVLTESSKQNTTFSFYLEVVGSVIRGAIESSNIVTILEELQAKIDKACQIRDETEQLITSGGAATKGDIHNVNKSLEQNKKKLSYKELQTNLLANLYKKIRKGNSATISLQGDSMFYGYDVTSLDKRNPSSQLTDDGVAHTKTRASKTPDEAIQEYCNLLFGENKIKIINRSYAGDTVITGAKHWSKNPNVDLVLLGYGINDSRGSYDYSGDVDTFLNGYRKIIEQQLEWGTAVALVTPLKARFHYDTTTITDVFTGAIYQLAKEYGIPVIDGDMLLQGYNYTFWSDSTHLNGKGYTVVGYRLVSTLIGNGLMQLNKINGKSFLSTNTVIQNLIYDEGVTVVNQDNLPTPSQGLENCGFGMVIPPSKSVTYSIFTDRENYCIIPSIYLKSTSGDIEVKINNGIQQADYNTDYIKNIMITEDENVSGVQNLDVNLRSSADNVIWEDDYKLNAIEPITITSCGLNTITIRNNTDANILLHGLLIEPLEDFYDNKGFCIISTHKNYTDTNPVAETRIKMDYLINMLGISNRLAQHYWYPLINVTVSNADASVFDTYQYRFGSVTGIYNFGLVESTQIISTSPKRMLENIEYDSENKEYILKWSGDLTVPSMINIRVADSGAMVKYYQPTNAIPTAKVGGVYVDKRTNTFKKCIDGSSWINM